MTKFRAFALVVVALCSASLAFAKDSNTEKTPAQEQPKVEEGFVSLFDGKTLDGWWKQDKVPKFHVGGRWVVKDGNIVGDQYPPGKGGFLATKKKYSDFEIRCEVKLDYPSDSGLFLRMADDGKSHQVTLDNRPDGQFGRIYLPWTHDSVHDSPDGIKAFKQKEWNDVRVRMEGEPARIQFWLNGKLVTDFQHTKETTSGVPREGYIALQVHPTVTTHVNWKEGNKVRYRNIRIHEIKGDEKKTAG
jgi:hypothetical protein